MGWLYCLKLNGNSGDIKMCTNYLLSCVQCMLCILYLHNICDTFVCNTDKTIIQRQNLERLKLTDEEDNYLLKCGSNSFKTQIGFQINYQVQG